VCTIPEIPGGCFLRAASRCHVTSRKLRGPMNKVVRPSRQNTEHWTHSIEFGDHIKFWRFLNE
jgi:hypothetical protein